MLKPGAEELAHAEDGSISGAVIGSDSSARTKEQGDAKDGSDSEHDMLSRDFHSQSPE